MLLLAVAAWLFCGAAAVSAQEAGGTADAAPDTLKSPRGGSLIPLPILFYQPETGTGFGVGVIYLFTMGGETRAEEGGRSFQSSIAATAIYTTKQQVITSIEVETYPGGGRYRALGNIAFLRFPTSLWGIGNEAPESLEEDYTPDIVVAGGEFQVEVARRMYAGGIAQVADRRLREIEEGGLIDAGAVPGTEDGTLITLGALLTRDSRSNNVYPRFGEYHQLRATRSLDVSGHGNDHSTFSLDLRGYLPVRSGVLALQALGIASGDVPPFDLMPQLGGESLLRGYFAGRYRDRSLNAFQAEYRSPMWHRVRTVLFAGAGQVADQVVDMRLDAYHSSAGFGFRFLLSRAEELNLHLDFGWGFDVESTGLYIGIGELY